MAAPQQRPGATTPCCCILHVDMDAFFAAVEQRDHPHLRGKPVIVGSPPERRGVVATASYEARAYGIRSAMPSRLAVERCPHAIFVEPRHEHYAAVSVQVMGILHAFTPVVEPVSIDEAFLDVRGAASSTAAATEVAQAIKERLCRETGLTGSVGVAPNKFLAKLASDLHKPDGLTVTPAEPEAIRGFLAPLPVRRIWGIGPRTEAILAARGIRTIGDLQAKTLPEVTALLGVTAGPAVHQLAFGIDLRPVDPTPHEEKSISKEETFATDIRDHDHLRRELVRLVERVGQRLRQAGKTAGTMHIKVRFGDFSTITRQLTLVSATCADRDLVRQALAFLARLPITAPVRLLGFGVSRLASVTAGDNPRQPVLFEAPEAGDAKRNAALDAAVDRIRNDYGRGSIRRGAW